MQSADWLARQQCKIERALDELERGLGEGEWFTGWGYGLADIAAGCALGYLELRCPEVGWRVAHPRLAALASRLASRPAFAATLPRAQPIPRQI